MTHSRKKVGKRVKKIDRRKVDPFSHGARIEFAITHSMDRRD